MTNEQKMTNLESLMERLDGLTSECLEHDAKQPGDETFIDAGSAISAAQDSLFALLQKACTHTKTQRYTHHPLPGGLGTPGTICLRCDTFQGSPRRRQEVA